MQADGGLSRRFLQAFILQALLISVTAMLGFWLARFVLEDVLIEQALEQEADWFWSQRSMRDDLRPPEARNIRGWLVTTAGGALPEGYAAFGPGLHPLSSEDGVTTLHVSARGDARLYLLFDGAGVDLLTTYFGLVPLALVLVALYLTAWVGYRATHEVLSPLTALARQISRMDVERIDPESLRQHRFVGDPDEEVAVLAGALADFAERLDAFVERERNFTRDASHELRSPLTVIAMAVEVLQQDGALPERSRASVDRIDRAVRDMRELVEAFLLLARESDEAFVRERVSVNDLVEVELERARMTGAGRVHTRIDAEGELWAQAPRQVLASLIGNLVRNAASHGDGEVQARIVDHELVIEDRGRGMDADELKRAFDPFFRGTGSGRGGHGVGLTIVQRLSDRFGWPVSIESEPGAGTRVHVHFPGAAFERRPASVPESA
jgi:signal transduction histidine kinase